ncbi:MAG: hypothetical protein ACOC4E_00425 [Patescibacteria group bacterium]
MPSQMTGRIGRGVRQPAARQQPQPQPSAFERSCAALEQPSVESDASSETAASPAARSVNPTSWYVGYVRHQKHGAAKVRLPHFGELALVERSLAQLISAAGVSLQRGEKVRLRLREKGGTPRFTVTHLKRDGDARQFSLDEAKVSVDTVPDAGAAEVTTASAEPGSKFVSGQLKQAPKGGQPFRFVALENGGDAFVPPALGKRSGLLDLNAGAELDLMVERGDRGWVALEVTLKKS